MPLPNIIIIGYAQRHFRLLWNITTIIVIIFSDIGLYAAMPLSAVICRHAAEARFRRFIIFVRHEPPRHYAYAIAITLSLSRRASTLKNMHTHSAIHYAAAIIITPYATRHCRQRHYYMSGGSAAGAAVATPPLRLNPPRAIYASRHCLKYLRPLHYCHYACCARHTHYAIILPIDDITCCHIAVVFRSDIRYWIFTTITPHYY